MILTMSRVPSGETGRTAGRPLSNGSAPATPARRAPDDAAGDRTAAAWPAQCARSRRAISALVSAIAAPSASTAAASSAPAGLLHRLGRAGHPPGADAERRALQGVGRAPPPRRRRPRGCAAAASRPAGRTAPAPRVRGCARRASCAPGARRSIAVLAPAPAIGCRDVRWTTRTSRPRQSLPVGC